MFTPPPTHTNYKQYCQALAGVGIFVLCILLSGCSSEKKPDVKQTLPTNTEKKSDSASSKSAKTNSTENPNTRKPQSLADVKPDFVLTTKDLFDENDEEREGIEEKYAGKVIELKGVVIGLDTTKKPYPSKDELVYKLRVQSKDSKSHKFLGCLLPDKVYPWKKILPGETVTLRGRAKVAFHFQLEDCAIIKREGELCKIVTADELAKAFDENEEEARVKYNHGRGRKNRWIVVKGIIAKVTVMESEGFRGSVEIQFKHSGQFKLKAIINESVYKSNKVFYDEAKELKMGDEITILGEPQAISFTSKGEFVFKESMLLKD